MEMTRFASLVPHQWLYTQNCHDNVKFGSEQNNALNKMQIPV